MTAAWLLTPGQPNSFTSQPACAEPGLLYRADVDGLRGVAVLTLLAIHCFPAPSPGGFVGIDVFFVLSGYLITLQLARLHAARVTDLRPFFMRRAQHLVPALCLVLAACLGFALLFTTPLGALAVAQSLVRGALFFSNLVAAQQLDLQAGLSTGDPLLHLWTLALTVQFYLIWPWVLIRCLRWPSLALGLILVVLILSFTAGLVLLADRPGAAFFGPVARAWELMAGAGLALLQVGRGSVADRVREWSRQSGLAGPAGLQALSVAGLVILLSSMWLIGPGARMPGWWAWLPCLGTLALLAAGPKTWIGRQVLGHPVLRFYGVVSYPLYLWHWPLLNFPAILDVPLTVDARVTVLLASVVLAAMTHELVGVRSDGPRRRAPRAWPLLAALAVVVALAWWVVQTDGLRASFPVAGAAGP